MCGLENSSSNALRITPGPRRAAAELRRELGARNVERAKGFAHEQTCGAVASILYREDELGGHGNFLPAAYRRIAATPAWKARLNKVYSGSRSLARGVDRKRMELDCANSSDALLMNVFCYPGVLARAAVCSLLGVERNAPTEFGFHPRTPLLKNKFDRTEIDLKLGDLLIEAKLTEGNFQSARADLVRRYRDLEDVFYVNLLPFAGGIFGSYQLIRGVLAAASLHGSFCVLCDGRRPDLIEDWYQVVSAVRSSALRCRLTTLTWQELAVSLFPIQQRFLEEKYGIDGGGQVVPQR